MSSWRRRTLLKLGVPVAGIFALVVACGSDTAPAAISAATATAVPAAPVATGVSDIAQAAAIPAGEVELGRAGFVHDDFRTQVATVIDVADSPALADAGGRTITVALRNLSSPNGAISSRATINFGSGFQNFVTLPGLDGEFRLYLNRDGSLGAEPDDSGFR